MSTNIGNLRVSIGADTADLARGIGRAKAHVQSFAKVAKVGALAAGAAFTAASVGMVAMANGGLSFVDAQAKMARQLDGSIDGLRALQLATGDAGVSTDIINKSVEVMGKRLAEAARRGVGPAHEALERLNLSAADLMAMDVDQRFAAIADRVKDLGYSAQETGDLMRQFGVRNGEVSIVLLQGSDAIRAARKEVEEFGLSIGGDAAAGVESANDAIARISFVFEGLRNQLAITVAPVLETLAVRFKSLAGEGGPLQEAVGRLVASFGELANQIMDPAFIDAAVLFGTTIAGAIVTLTKAMGFLIEHAEVAGTTMIALGGAMAFFSGPIGLAIAAVAGGVFLLSGRMNDSATAADAAADAEGRLQAALDLVDGSSEDAVASGGRLITTHIDQARAAVEAAKAELALVRAKQQAGKALLDQNPLTAGDSSGMAEDMAANVAKAEAQLAALDAQLVQYQKTLEGFRRGSFPTQGTGSGGAGDLAGDPITEATEDTKKFTIELEALLSRLDPTRAKFRAYSEDFGVLVKAYQSGEITQLQFNKYVDELDEQLKSLPASTSAATAGLNTLGEAMGNDADIASDMAGDINAAVGSLIDRIDGGTDVLREFGIELAKIFAIQGITALLGGDDWMGDLFSIGENALGTDNWRGGLSWVGERGPELVNLPMGAQVIPNNKLGSMGSGGSSFTYAPTIDARGASLAAVQELDQRMRADAAQFNAKVVGAVKSAQSKRAL